ncbi:Armadillo-type fold [Vigna unguiculata]|uniref:Armadillo-type fold n=1 Tax=Vigna unguiculata TaxID=3917 RepID=A0A4D6KRX2_VIGUN|nr:Armadillo-type fold [Vigna unguiculata]
MRGRALKYLISLMRSAEERVRQYVVIALAHLCSPPDYENCILKQDAAKSSGIELLLNILQSQIQKRDASMALSILASRANFISSLLKAISPSPTSQMDLGEEFLNNEKISDVTFLVEGGASAVINFC